MASKAIINDIFMLCKAQLAWIASRIVPPHEIEDIVQETYVRVCQFRTKGEVREPRALLLKTAKNIALDHVKRAEWRLNSSYEDESMLAENDKRDSNSDPFNQVASDQEFGQFCEIVRELPQQCKKVFILKKVYGYSQKEVAKELGISESTVEKHIAKGMKHCGKTMWKKHNDVKSKESTAVKGVRS
ncbi:MAG: RNA polymerase sigma factor (sigma-70 family) [Polaribacter sp.]|jgi:RNA polymerase sigma factor (sigma-70 family)